VRLCNCSPARFLAASGDGPHLAAFCHACGVIRLYGSCNAATAPLISPNVQPKLNTAPT
jgi:hypothetical protein